MELQSTSIWHWHNVCVTDLRQAAASSEQGISMCSERSQMSGAMAEKILSAAKQKGGGESSTDHPSL